MDTDSLVEQNRPGQARLIIDEEGRSYGRTPSRETFGTEEFLMRRDLALALSSNWRKMNVGVLAAQPQPGGEHQIQRQK
jgi:hypothetical protein